MARHRSVRRGRERHPSERVHDAGILARAHHDEVGRELADRRQHDPIERREVGWVARPGRKRDVDGRPRAFLVAHLVQRSPADREQVVLVQGDEQDRWVGIKRVLRPIPVVNVPVDDRHPLCPMTPLGMARRDRDVCVDAEPHAPVRHRVVTWRPHQRKRMVNGSPHHRIDGGHHAADRQPGDRLAIPAHRRPHPRIATGLADIGHSLHVVRGVIQPQRAIANQVRVDIQHRLRQLEVVEQVPGSTGYGRTAQVWNRLRIRIFVPVSNQVKPRIVVEVLVAEHESNPAVSAFRHARRSSHGFIPGSIRHIGDKQNGRLARRGAGFPYIVA